MSKIDCPDRYTLQRFMLGEILDKEAERLEDHLSSCPDCSSAIEEIDHRDEISEAFVAELDIDVDESVLVASINRAKRLRADANTKKADDTITSKVGVPLSSNLDLSFLDTPEMPDEIGRLAGYRILEVIGQGGMGVVFRAEDSNLERDIALKVMLPAMASTRSAKERFLREAKAMAAIEHNNIVHIFHVGEHNDLPFFAMQLLRGESLQDCLAREGSLNDNRVLRIGRQIALGLDAAHKAGLIHRDIKPDNIWLEQQTERVKILDFGLVRDDSNEELTQSGLVVGTPKYMAPEQALGEPADQRSDLFSLGSVLYHSSTGELPFPGKNVTAILVAVAEAKNVDAHFARPDVNPELSSIISRLLEKEPQKRYASAIEVIEAIDEIEGSSPPKRQRDLRPQTLGHSRLPSIIKMIVGGAAIIAALAVISFSLKSPKGTLQLEADDKVAVEFSAEAVSVKDTETGDTYELQIGENKLQPGDYEIQVVNPQTGLSFSSKSFSITRGETTHLSATLLPISNQDSPIDAGTVDRTAAEWILSIGGRVDIAKSTGGTDRLKSGQILPHVEFRLVGIDINSLTDLEPEGFEKLQGLKHLGNFNAWNSSISDEALARMTDSGKIRFTAGQIQLQDTKVTNRGIAFLKPHEQLTYIRLDRTSFSDLTLLAPCVRLAVLSVSGTSIDGDSLAALVDLDRLEQLELGGEQLSGRGPEYIARLNNLKKLSIDNAKEFDGLFLRTMPQLNSLTIISQRFNETFPTSLSNLNELEFLTLGGNVPRGILQAIPSLENLRSLGLVDTSMKGEAVANFAHKQPQLRELSLRYCHIRDTDVRQLSASQHLTRIEIKGCAAVTYSAVQALRTALPKVQIDFDKDPFSDSTVSSAE